MSAERIAPDLRRHAIGVRREFAVVLYRELWRLTPVLTGYCRSRWRLRYDPRNGRPARITNDCDYLQFLNNGSSEQAPAGFIQMAQARVLRMDIEPSGNDGALNVRGYLSADKDAEPPKFK